MTEPRRQTWLAVVLAALGSVLLFHLSVLALFFLVPLARLKSSGLREEVKGMALAAVGFLAAALVFARIGNGWTVWDTVNLAIPLGLLTGWLVIEVLESKGWRFLERLGIVTLGVAVLSVPILMQATSNVQLENSWKQGFELVWKQVLEAGGSELKTVLTPANKESFFLMVKESVLGGFLPVVFLFWGMTELWSRLSPRSQKPRVEWSTFRIPSVAVVPFLALVGIVLARNLLHNLGSEWSGGVLWYLALNVMVVFWMVYALAGWGILDSLMRRANLPGVFRGVTAIMLVMGLVSGGWLSALTLIGLPLLAVLELWIDFRKNLERG